MPDAFSPLPLRADEGPSGINDPFTVVQSPCWRPRTDSKQRCIYRYSRRIYAAKVCSPSPPSHNDSRHPKRTTPTPDVKTSVHLQSLDSFHDAARKNNPPTPLHAERFFRRTRSQIKRTWTPSLMKEGAIAKGRLNISFNTQLWRTGGSGTMEAGSNAKNTGTGLNRSLQSLTDITAIRETQQYVHQLERTQRFSSQQPSLLTERAVEPWGALEVDSLRTGTNSLADNAYISQTVDIAFTADEFDQFAGSTVFGLSTPSVAVKPLYDLCNRPTCNIGGRGTKVGIPW